MGQRGPTAKTIGRSLGLDAQAMPRARPGPVGTDDGEHLNAWQEPTTVNLRNLVTELLCACQITLHFL